MRIIQGIISAHFMKEEFNMKKRLAVLMLAGMMMTFSSVGVMAGETEATTEASSEITFNYEDIDQSVYDGTWVSTGLGFDMYLPSDWQILDVSDDDAAQGIVYQVADSEKGWNVVVSYHKDMGASVSDIYTSLQQAGYQSLYNVDLNGIPAVGFDIDDKKVSGVAFADSEGAMYTVQLGPNDDKDFLPYAKNILMSISPSETAESETETEA